MKSLFENRLPGTRTKSDPASAAVAPMVPTHRPGNLSTELARTDLKLGILNQFLYNREAGRAMREKLAQITVTIMEKQRAEIYQRLMLDLDINKKRAFQQYMEKVGFLNKELIQKSNDMERDLRDMLRQEITAIFEEKRDWEKQIEALNLTNAERDAEIERMERWIQFANDQVEGKLTTLVETHSSSLKVTLELLREQAIDGETAMRLE